MPFTPRHPEYRRSANFNDFLEYYRYLIGFGLAFFFIVCYLFIIAANCNIGRYRPVKDDLVFDTCTGAYLVPAHLTPHGGLMHIKDYVSYLQKH